MQDILPRIVRLTGKPSPSSWAAITDIFEAIEPGPLREACVSSAAERLGAWPDSLRVLNTDNMERLPPFAWCLARRLDLRRTYWSKTPMRPDGLRRFADLTELTQLDLSARREFSSLDFLKHFPNLEELKLTGTKIADLGPLTTCENLRALHLGEQAIDLLPLTDLPHLRSLALTASTGMSRLVLPQLTSLELHKEDLYILDHFPGLAALEELWLHERAMEGLIHLRSLSAAGLSLATLRLDYADDLGGLETQTELRELHILHGKPQALSLSPLTSLTQLTVLNARTRVEDLTPLDGHTKIESVTFKGEMALSPLNGSHIKAFDGFVSDLRELGKHATTMESLELPDCAVTDFGPLHAFTELRIFSCESAHLSDLTPLSEAAGLEQLNIANSGVSDLTPLVQLTSLSKLELTFVPLSDLGPIAHLPLQYLDLCFTKVTSLAPLAGMQTLAVLLALHIPVTDLGPLSALHELVNLCLMGSKVTELAPLTHLESLRRLDIAGLEIKDIDALERIPALKALTVSRGQQNHFGERMGLTLPHVQINAS